MLAALLLVFREGLEAALVITVILAATRGVAQRGRYILAGILAGAAGAGILAACTGALSNAMGGIGAEIFNASVLLLAVGLLAWHVVWMGHHGKEMAAEIKQLGRDITLGIKPLSALAIVSATTMLREGSEIVLFMQGLLASADHSAPLFIGGILGICAAVAAGGLMYLGMVRIPVGKLFSATNVLLMLIAAGMAGKAANYLVAAGALPEVSNQVWNTSAFIGNDSWVGETLSAFMGYSATPTGIQLIFFASTLALLLFFANGGAALLPRKFLAAAAVALVVFIGVHAHAADDYTITLKDKTFSPAELIVPAGQKIKITVKNLNAKAAEFESETLHREKLVPAGGAITVALGPLNAGSYAYVNDFDETVKGMITAK
jgi:high-affinity iron transporter